MNDEENKLILTKIFIESEDYEFKNKEDSRSFIEQLYFRAEMNYEDGCKWQTYPVFADYMYSSDVDSLAYWLYSDEFDKSKNL